MGKYSWVLAVTIIAFLCLGRISSERNKGVNGGYYCAACTFAVGLVEQYSIVKNETVSKNLGKICDYLPGGEFKQACEVLFKTLGPQVLDLIYILESPDIVCQHLNFCYTEPSQPSCNLYPKLPEEKITKKHKYKERLLDISKKIPWQSPVNASIICKIPGIEILCYIYEKIENQQSPPFDIDQDKYGTLESMRGTNWRGKDCNDYSSEMHPGTRPLNKDIEVDSNCNGIYGINATTKVAYEDELCANSGQLGMAVIGDSVGAHFHIPPEWAMPQKYAKDIFTHLPQVVFNQLDFPMTSAATGYKNLTWPILEGPVRSIYDNLRTRNRCNHRDYQNIGVNGNKSPTVKATAENLARHQTKDFPLLIILELVGNDVCNHFLDTLDHMTTPDDAAKYLIETLQYLDTILPNGSHILLFGMADGRALWDNLKDRIHPLGALKSDVKYPDFYDYLNCLQISPCRGWMTSDKAKRDQTSQRAKEISDKFREVVDHTNYTHFDMHYVDCPLDAVLNEWEKKHGNDSAWQLIEPVDGFHPNQLAHALIADFVWNHLEFNVPHFLGKVNPHNQKIQDIFRDQGGY